MPFPMERLSTALRIQFRAAERLGLSARILDEEHGRLFCLSLPEGREPGPKGKRRQLLIGGRSALNDAASAAIAQDKHYTHLVLKEAGFALPETARCLAPEAAPHRRLLAEGLGADLGLGAALALAERRGYPLVVKPNGLSCSVGVRRVDDEETLREGIEAAWALDRVALAQTVAEGRDLRLDFLDGRYLLGYERAPLVLEGDGRREVAALLAEADPRGAQAAYLDNLLALPAFDRALSEAGVRERGEALLKLVLKAGERVEVASTIRNLNGGATGRRIPAIPPALEAHCAAIGAAVGLRHFGIDLRMQALDADPHTATIIEVNASPLLNQMFLMGYEEEVVTAQIRIFRELFDI